MIKLNYILHHFSIDLGKEISQGYIPVRKSETQHKLAINLTIEGSPYEISTGVTAQIIGKYPSGTTFQNNATVENDTINYVLTSTDTANAGDVSCEVKLVGSNSEVLISPTFIVKVNNTSGS